MTSGTLRTILIVGAAAATVSIAACKPSVTVNGTNTATVAADNSMAMANSATNMAQGAMNAAANASATAPMGGNSTSTTTTTTNTTAP
jgi:hypothetical protein